MEEKVVKLNDEEIEIIKTYQNSIETNKLNLGALRRQYLVEERKVLEILVKSENDLYAHIKLLAQDKNIPTDETWIYNAANHAFMKKE